MQQQYDSDEREAKLLIDASNAFNGVNRQAALLNINRLCPALSIISNSNNTYGASIKLFLPDGGSIPNSKKTILLVKPEMEDRAEHLFASTGISVKTDGVRYLDGAVGQQHFLDRSKRKHVETWTDEMESLSRIATTQPHTAYSSFIRGVKSKWHYAQPSGHIPPDLSGSG